MNARQMIIKNVTVVYIPLRKTFRVLVNGNLVKSTKVKKQAIKYLVEYCLFQHINKDNLDCFKEFINKQDAVENYNSNRDSSGKFTRQVAIQEGNKTILIQK